MSINNNSNLLIISHNQDQFKGLSQILSHYFPAKGNEQTQSSFRISILNKYYKAEVQLSNKLWTQLMNFTLIPTQAQGKNQEEEQKNQQNQGQTQSGQKQEIKYDFMIMLVNEQNDGFITFENLDKVIEKYNPDQFVLLINSKSPQDKWKHQQTVLDKCNNFIQIIKQNLLKIYKSKPNWARGSLLNDQEQQQSGIFSIFDRIQTTRWSTLVDLKNEKNNKKAKQNHIEQIQMKTEQEKEQQSNNCPQPTQQQPEQQKPINQNYKIDNQAQEVATKTQQKTNQDTQEQQIYSDDQQNNQQKSEQLDQKQLQKQMLQFQSMMGQMMAFKANVNGMNDNQSKKKAQDLFSRMFKGMMNN